MKFLIVIWLLLFSLATVGQDRTNWTTLDYLNNDKENPFTTEVDISGLCFVVLADDFNYYTDPVVIKGANSSEVLKIKFTESGGLLTTYKGKTYKQFDSSNAFKPWLFIDNPDYFRIAFECVDTIGTSYKVRLSDTDFTMIDKKNKNFKKESISDFVSGWTSLGFDFNRAINPVKESPKDDSKTIVHKEQQKYKIWRGESLEVRGDWIKVKTVKDEVGWVRWRKGNTVLIRMYYAC